MITQSVTDCRSGESWRKAAASVSSLPGGASLCGCRAEDSLCQPRGWHNENLKDVHGDDLQRRLALKFGVLEERERAEGPKPRRPRRPALVELLVRCGVLKHLCTKVICTSPYTHSDRACHLGAFATRTQNLNQVDDDGIEAKQSPKKTPSGQLALRFETYSSQYKLDGSLDFIGRSL